MDGTSNGLVLAISRAVTVAATGTYEVRASRPRRGPILPNPFVLARFRAVGVTPGYSHGDFTFMTLQSLLDDGAVRRLHEVGATHPQRARGSGLRRKGRKTSEEIDFQLYLDKNWKKPGASRDAKIKRIVEQPNHICLDLFTHLMIRTTRPVFFRSCSDPRPYNPRPL